MLYDSTVIEKVGLLFHCDPHPLLSSTVPNKQTQDSCHHKIQTFPSVSSRILVIGQLTCEVPNILSAGGNCLNSRYVLTSMPVWLSF